MNVCVDVRARVCTSVSAHLLVTLLSFNLIQPPSLHSPHYSLFFLPPFAICSLISPSVLLYKQFVSTWFMYLLATPTCNTYCAIYFWFLFERLHGWIEFACNNYP